MPHESKTKDKIRAPQEVKDVGAALRVSMTPERLADLETFITDAMPEIKHRRVAELRKRDKWRMTLKGVRWRQARDPYVSHISVPYTTWVSAAERAKTNQDLFEASPLLTIEPSPREDNADTREACKHLQDFLQAQWRNPRALRGLQAGRKTNNETVNYGTAAFKVFRSLDTFRLQAPRGTETPPVVSEPGRIQWEHIAFEDLLYFNGFGTDTQEMPFVGHQFEQTWTDIQKNAAAGYYNAAVVKSIEHAYRNTGVDNKLPPLMRPHEVAEIYTEWPLTANGNPAPVMVFYHLKHCKILGVLWNKTPNAIRPIYITNYDSNPDPHCAVGVGVCEKLEGAQDETDEIHNISVESAKGAGGHAIILRAGSDAETQLGGDNAVLPREIVVTGDVNEDATTLPLGDARAAQHLAALEGITRTYVQDMFGFDVPRGDTGAGKRVPQQLGLAIKREGNITGINTRKEMAEVYTEAMYLTLELWRENIPFRQLQAALPDDAIDILQRLVFTPDGVPLRERFIVTVHATDSASINESRRQDMMQLLTLLPAIYDRLLQYGQLAMTFPPEATRGMQEILSKMQALTKHTLTTMEGIQDPDEVIPDVARIIGELNEVRNTLATGAAGANDQAQLSDGTPDLGAGVV